jgi:urease accessory protein
MRHPIVSKLSVAALVAGAFTGFSSAAFAHVGDHSGLSFVEGLAHPFTGLDHMLAMVAVGAVFGVSGRELPWIEIGVASSVLVLGAAVALALRPSLVVSAALVALLALLHGYSHGVELPASASALTYGAGFVAATLALHAIGVAIGLSANAIPLRYVARTAGAAIAAVGVFLLATG